MEDRFDICVAFTLRREGGYVDDPADPGGATKWGSPWGTTGNGPTIPVLVTSR
jgi:lysozyme family protein